MQSYVAILLSEFQTIVSLVSYYNQEDIGLHWYFTSPYYDMQRQIKVECLWTELTLLFCQKVLTLHYWANALECSSCKYEGGSKLLVGVYYALLQRLLVMNESGKWWLKVLLSFQFSFVLILLMIVFIFLLITLPISFASIDYSITGSNSLSVINDKEWKSQTIQGPTNGIASLVGSDTFTLYFSSSYINYLVCTPEKVFINFPRLHKYLALRNCKYIMKGLQIILLFGELSNPIALTL